MIPRKNILTCDACGYGVGAVLSHIMLNDSEKAVPYASCSLSAAEKNYSRLDKEGLGIIFGVKKFHQYLLGQTFRIVMDHKPLFSLFNPTRPILDSLLSRIIRWSLLMSSYDYSIMYKPGKKHCCYWHNEPSTSTRKPTSPDAGIHHSPNGPPW